MQILPKGSPQTSLESVIDPHWPPPLGASSSPHYFSGLPTPHSGQSVHPAASPFLLLASQLYSPVVASASGQ